MKTVSDRMMLGSYGFALHTLHLYIFMLITRCYCERKSVFLLRKFSTMENEVYTLGLLVSGHQYTLAMKGYGGCQGCIMDNEVGNVLWSLNQYH